jgi:pyridoxine/pyridoxamine 5'-phosphate oxidase
MLTTKANTIKTDPIKTRKHIIECVSAIAGESAGDLFAEALTDEQVNKLSSALADAVMTVANDFTMDQRIVLLRSLTEKARIVYGDEVAKEFEAVVDALARLIKLTGAK